MTIAPLARALRVARTAAVAAFLLAAPAAAGERPAPGGAAAKGAASGPAPRGGSRAAAPADPRAAPGALRLSDVRPAVPAALVAAHQRLLARDPEGAAALALSSVAPDALAALSRGAALVAARRGKEAVADLRRAADRAPPEVRDWARFYLGQALSLVPDYMAAAAALESIAPSAVVAGEAALLRASALFAAGRPADSRAAAQPVADGRVPGDRAAALAAVARAADALGDSAAAREAWRQVYLSYPLHPAAAEAQTRLGTGFAPTLAEQVQRAELLLDAHQNDRAVREVAQLTWPAALAATDDGASAVLADPLGAGLVDQLLCRARFVWGKALRKMRQHTRALSILGPVVKACEAEVAARAHYIAATNAQVLQLPDAAALWEALARRHPQHSLADDALLFAAEVHHRRGEYASERALLERLVTDYPQSDQRSEALFRLFWSERRQGRAREGLAWLLRLEQEYDAPDESSPAERARYWRARTLLDAGSEGAREGIELLERLAWERPLGWYGVLARGWLDEARVRSLEAAVPDVPAPEVLRLGVLAGDPHLAAARTLLRAGMLAEAARELAQVDRRPAQGGKDPHALIALATLLDLAGDRRAAHALARAELRPFARGASDAGWAAARVAYPQAFLPEVIRHAPATRLPREFLQGLIREESALDPAALSGAGAVGLTQLMPETARQVARRLQLPVPDTDALSDPDLSLRLGGAYLGQLVARFKGNPVLAIAAYNAGPAAVERWLRAAGPGAALDAWVEEIPIEETRQYVKRVVRSANAYRILYGAKGARLLRLPATVP